MIILILLLLASIVPLACVFVFRKVLHITLPVFLLAIVAGIFSLIAAMFAQRLLPLAQTGRAAMLYGIFVRISLTEEAARLVFLIALCGVLYGLRRRITPVSILTCGLTAGFAFACLETAVFAASNADVTLLRLFSAAPLHGACGIRCAATARALFAPLNDDIPPENPRRLRTVHGFFYAVILHGFYDTLIIRGGFFAVIAVIFAITSLVSGCFMIRKREEGEDFSS